MSFAPRGSLAGPLERGPVTLCEACLMQRASLVVMATTNDRPSRAITDSVAKALGTCRRPVLLISTR